MDIVFALDASGSIERDNFERIVQFVGGVVQSLVIRTDQTPNGFQVALVTFADTVEVRFYLNTYNNKELMLSAVKVPYTRGRTNLDQALRYARRSLLRNIARLLQPRLYAVLVTSAKELYFIF